MENIDMIQWLDGIIKRVENEVKDNHVFMMGNWCCCVLGTLGYDRFHMTDDLSSELGFYVCTLDVVDYKVDLTETQAEVIGLFTTAYGGSITKEKWLIIAKDVLTRLGETK